MKVKLFTHTDLDGIGCAILAKLIFKTDVDIEYCNYDDINEKVNKFFFGYNVFEYDYVFITDISVSEELADSINNSIKSTTCLPIVQLFDHHPTALNLNKYDWCNVIVESRLDENSEIHKESGTSLFYKNIICKYPISYFIQSEIIEMVENIRRYDTWEWNTKYNDIIPKKWNDLLNIIGKELFINKIIHKITISEDFKLEKEDLFLLDIEQNKINKYIETKQEQIIVKDIIGYKAGVIFAEQYISELGNTLSKNNLDLDFIIIINPANAVSYRGIKDIDLGKDVAKIFGGGGHPKAAGSPISNETRNKIIELIFN